MTYRSLLFVPGVRPERFAKALASGPDAVCIDLEDAVPPEAKDAARASAISYLQDRGDAPVGVRVNGVGAIGGEDDYAALSASTSRPAFVMVPKVDNAEQLAHVRAAIGEDCPPLWPVIETTEGLRNAWDIAAAAGVGGVLFGGADYSAEIGSDMGWGALVFARGALVAACARARVELHDVPYLDVQDPNGLVASTARVKAMGFTGRACIHPNQVAPVNGVFTSTPAETAQARRVLGAFEAAAGGAALLDGKLIDLPVILSARRTLERAGGA